MAIWYEAEKTEEGIRSFLESNCGFHDHRIEKIEYLAARNSVRIYLSCGKTEGVVLHFGGVKRMNVTIPEEYGIDYIQESSVILLKNGCLLWTDIEQWEDNTDKWLEEARPISTWAEAERILWAVTDQNGTPVEMPKEYIDPVCNIWGKEVRKHYELKPFDGDPDSI